MKSLRSSIVDFETVFFQINSHLKKIILTALCILVFATSVLAQVMFQRYYGDFSSEGARAVIQTSDGGYALVGNTYSFGAGLEDIYLVKTNAAGNIIWSRTYGGSDIDNSYDLKQVDDGGYVIVGGSRSFGATSYETYILNVDSTGNLNWSYTYPAGSHDVLTSVIMTGDGGIVTCGQRNGRICFLKVNAAGSLEWMRELQSSGVSYASAIIQTADSGYAVSGFLTDAITGYTDALLIRTDSQGDTLWTRRLGGSLYDEMESIQQTADGGFVILGQSSSFGLQGLDMLIIRLDAIGNILWSKAYGVAGNEYGADVLLSPSGELNLLGRTLAFGAGNWDFVLIHTDTSGNQMWSKNYGGSSTDYPFALISTSDGGFAMAGEAYGGGLGQTDMFLVKTDDAGITTCFIDSLFTQTSVTTQVYPYAPSAISSPAIPTSPATVTGSVTSFTNSLCATGIYLPVGQTITIYPNPFTETIELDLPSITEQITVVIRNMLGHVVTKQSFPHAQTVRINPRVEPGMYTIEVYERDNVLTRQIIICH